MRRAVIVLNGQAYAGTLDIKAEQAFDKVEGSCRVTISEIPGQVFPAKLGMPAQLLLMGQPVVTGFVNEVDANHGWKDHTIGFSFRDKTQDFIDSTVGPGVELKPPVTLKQVVERTVKKMGLNLSVIDKVGAPPFGSAEVPVAGIHEYGFNFCDRWARNRQCVLTTDGKGNIVIDRNQQRRGPGWLRKSFEDSPANNVLKAKYKNSDKDRHNQTAVAGQKSQNDMDYWEGQEKDFKPGQAGPMSKQWGVHLDDEIRPERRRHYRSERGLDGGTPRKAAKWRSNVAKARGFQYTATVQGFEMAPGQLWWPGFVIPVRDDHFEINDVLLIVKVQWHLDFKGGATTEVVCTYKDGFSDGDGGGGGRGSSGGVGSAAAGSFRGAQEEGLDQPEAEGPAKLDYDEGD